MCCSWGTGQSSQVWLSAETLCYSVRVVFSIQDTSVLPILLHRADGYDDGVPQLFSFSSVASSSVDASAAFGHDSSNLGSSPSNFYSIYNNSVASGLVHASYVPFSSDASDLSMHDSSFSGSADRVLPVLPNCTLRSWLPHLRSSVTNDFGFFVRLVHFQHT